jgi:hypothetical protein
MAASEYRERLLRAVDQLPNEKAAKLVEFAESLCGRQAATSRPPRKLGFYRGQIHVSPSFNDPLPDDVLEAFEGGGQ